jgi:hypothetical protein
MVKRILVFPEGADGHIRLDVYEQVLDESVKQDALISSVVGMHGQRRTENQTPMDGRTRVLITPKPTCFRSALQSTFVN